MIAAGTVFTDELAAGEGSSHEAMAHSWDLIEELATVSTEEDLSIVSPTEDLATVSTEEELATTAFLLVELATA